jgi:branched-chain amino acid transport system permease protein
LSGQSTWQKRLYTILPYAFILIVLFALPNFLGSYFLGMLTKVLIFAIFAISLDLVMGYTGLLSMGHAAFLGVAGYTIGILATHSGIHLFWILLSIAIGAALIAAVVIGYISLRVSGVYFLLVTLALGQLLTIVATKWYSVTGGTNGLVGILRPDIGIAGFHFTTLSFYYLVFIAFVICFILLYIIVNSSFGKTLIGIKENELRMRALGFNTWALKYSAVIIAGAFAGVAGIFYAYFYGAIVPGSLAMEMSSMVMLMVIIGGPATLYGPFIGATLVVLLQHFASIYVPERWPMILGGIFVICVMFVRGGFAAYFSRCWTLIRYKIYSISHPVERQA